MSLDSPFYKEAYMATSKFELKKGIADVRKWDEEHLFYNPLILSKNGKVLKETEYLRRNDIYKLGQLLEETAKQSRNLPYNKSLVTLARNLRLDTHTKKEDIVILSNTKIVEMKNITQKELYEDAILKTTTDHVYQTKWITKLQT